MTENDRTQTARDNDDSDLIENIIEAPDFGGRHGQRPAKDVGTRDELKTGDGADPSITRVRGSDTEEGKGTSRADFDGG